MTIEPEWSLSDGMAKIYNFNRTPSGTHTIYTYAAYREWRIPLKFIPTSAATFINSIFLGPRIGQLEINVDSVTSVYSVMVLNTKSPMNQMVKPDINYWQGELLVSEY